MSYSVALLVITIISIISSIYDTLQSNARIRKMAETKCSITVIRSGKEEIIDQSDCVPGDLVKLTEKDVADLVQVPVDMVVIQGKCVMNESILTGESVPVVKSAIEDTATEIYDPYNDSSKKYTIFAGSKFLQVSHNCQAIVIKTGFQTTKGNLIREIMYPKKVEFSFNRDTYFFILGSFLVFLVLMGITIPRMIHLGHTGRSIMFKELDLLVCAIPPSLPAVLTSCTVFAMKWLKKKQIFCVSPQRVPVCGRITSVVFDKTGTLTCEGLSFKGFKPTEDEHHDRMIEAMAVCHSLSHLKHSEQLVGDPMDIEIYRYASTELASIKMDETTAKTKF